MPRRRRCRWSSCTRRRWFPGFLLAGLYIVYVIARAIIEPEARAEAAQGGDRRAVGRRSLLLLVKSFFPLAVLILSVLGAILFGLATPTEAAAVGALGRLLLAAGYRALTWAGSRKRCF